MDQVIQAYREACVLVIALRKMQGVHVDDLIVKASMIDSNLKVDPRPRLIIFGFGEDGLNRHWMRHETTLRRAGLDKTRLIMEPHPRDIRLSRGTFPEGRVDEAQDILISAEGPEIAEKMTDWVRHHKLSAIARFAPIFTTPGFQFVVSREPAPELPSSNGAPVPNFSETAYQFVEAAYDSGWVELADWRTWSTTPEARELTDVPARIVAASEDQLGRLLTFLIRNDHFHPGTLNAAFESGILTAIVQRAQALLEA